MMADRFAVSVILLSYRRPQNLGRIVDSALSVSSCREIVVSNNNPDINILDFMAGYGDKVKIIQQSDHLPAALRFQLARQSCYDYFLAIDDDLFLRPHQIELLIGHLYSDETITHGGPWGQKKLYEEDDIRLKGWLYPNSEVDVLNRAYAFARPHVVRFFDLLYRINCKSILDLGPADDIVLSFCGSQRPYCHDLGAWESCSTSNTAGIALWKEDGFASHRLEVFRKLEEITGMLR
jgi:glycosyltransferase involved in cell wall biosynthesis